MLRLSNLFYKTVKGKIQSWLDKQTDLPIVVFKFRNIMLIRFGLISSIALFMALIFFIIVSIEIGFSSQALNFFLFLFPINLVLFSILLNYILSFREILKDWNKLKNVSFGFFGGLLGVVISFFITHWMYGTELRLFFDGSALVGGFMHGFARIACINYGCCHGKVIPEYECCDKLSITYKDPASKAVRISKLHNQPLYPIQFYESIGCISIGFFILFLALFYYKVGLLTGVYMLLYGLLRFYCEFYRGELDTPYWKHFSVYQWISIFFIVAGFGVTIFSLFYFPQATFIHFHWDTVYQLKDYIAHILFMPFVVLFFYGFHYTTIGKWWK